MENMWKGWLGKFALALFFIATVGVLTGCSHRNVSNQSPPSPNGAGGNSFAFSDLLKSSEGTLSSNELPQPYPYIGNGFEGVRISPSGLFDPKCTYVRAGTYDSAENQISLPCYLPSEISIEGAPLTITRDYHQSFQFSTQTWQATFTDQTNGGPVFVTVRITPTKTTIAEEWQFACDRPFLTVSAKEGGKLFTGSLPRIGGQQFGFTALANTPLGFIKHTAEPRDSATLPQVRIDGDIVSEQAINSMISYLKMGVPDSGGLPISPMGTSSTFYKGHVFWDADIWISPVLDLLFPKAATSFAQYRLSHFNKSKPIDGFTVAPPFPWESAGSGAETAPSTFAREVHISGDVLWNLTRANALGLHPSWSAFPTLSTVQQAVAGFYRSGLKKNADGSFSMPDILSPDENHTGSDDLYTNLIAQWAINGGTWLQNPKVRLALPQDKDSFLNYAGDPVRAYKQVAGLLAVYPLQYPPAVAQAKEMLDRFGNKTIPNGPAMSTSINCLIEARIGQESRAYADWNKAWQTYCNNPLLLFAEKPNGTQTYFQTGAAGCLQAFLYGFLGFTIDSVRPLGAQWSQKLQGGYWFGISPHLPLKWKHVSLSPFWILGKPYRLEISNGGGSPHVTVTQGVN